MSALSGLQIKDRLAEKNVDNRLVVSPILEPSEQLRDGQASVDVRLGFSFALVAPSLYGQIDELDFKISAKADLSNMYHKMYVPFGGNIVIHPHQLILAQTFEYLRLPPDLMAYVVGRSTWGRLGLIVATAVGIHPGYAGSLTLELRNLGEAPLSLRPGQTIAQLFFHTVEIKKEGKTTAQSKGQYGGSVDIIPKKLSSKETNRKLDALKKRREK